LTFAGPSNETVCTTSEEFQFGRCDIEAVVLDVLEKSKATSHHDDDVLQSSLTVRGCW
jgi:hypothetical protein